MSVDESFQLLVIALSASAIFNHVSSRYFWKRDKQVTDFEVLDREYQLASSKIADIGVRNRVAPVNQIAALKFE